MNICVIKFYDIELPDFIYLCIQAIANAWKDACASTMPSKVIVPKGIYKLKEANFNGPCKAPIELQVFGTLQAPPDGAQLSKPDTWIMFSYLDRFTLSGTGIFDGQGQQAWKANDCHKNPKCSSIAIVCILVSYILLFFLFFSLYVLMLSQYVQNMRFHSVKNSLVKDVTSLNSKNFHVNVLGCERLTFQHFTVTAPGTSVNTDGIHIGRSTGINITDSNISTGDDCISIGDGTKQLTITKLTCGPGHGISIGSLGRYPKEEPVTGIYIKSCTMSNTMNGIRIKTWPNSPAASIASDIHFEDIIMNNVGNPILIDQEYCPWNLCNKQVLSILTCILLLASLLQLRYLFYNPILYLKLTNQKNPFMCDMGVSTNLN